MIQEDPGSPYPVAWRTASKILNLGFLGIEHMFA